MKKAWMVVALAWVMTGAAGAAAADVEAQIETCMGLDGIERQTCVVELSERLDKAFKEELTRRESRINRACIQSIRMGDSLEPGYQIEFCKIRAKQKDIEALRRR
jgi:hypothetical protein